MVKNWWFKFEYRLWKSDPNLAQCSLAARGLWLEILCHMYDQDVFTITCSFEQLGRMCRCDSSEIAKYAVELKAANVADVTLGNGNVTLLSRRLKRHASDKEQTRLRVQRHRGNASVTQQSKSKSKEKEIREEYIREEPTRNESPSPDPKPQKIILPLDWKPSTELLSWTRSYAPGFDVQSELDDFLDFWRDIATRDNKRTLRGWDATWKKRVKALKAPTNGRYPVVPSSVGKSITPVPDPNCRTCGDAGEVTRPKAGGQFAWEVEFVRCPECSPMAVAV
jgi:hypothetical protein